MKRAVQVKRSTPTWLGSALKLCALCALGAGLSSACGGPSKRTCTPEVNQCMNRCPDDGPAGPGNQLSEPRGDVRGPCRTACEDRYCK